MNAPAAQSRITLTPEAQSVRAVLKQHERAISYKVGYPHKCKCGWYGEGGKGTSILDHIAEIVADELLAPKPKECAVPSTHTIEMHRALNEVLCPGCIGLLRTLA